MSPRSGPPRTSILHVRLTDHERARLQRAAEAEYADHSAWARSVILKALDQWERDHPDAPRLKPVPPGR